MQKVLWLLLWAVLSIACTTSAKPPDLDAHPHESGEAHGRSEKGAEHASVDQQHAEEPQVEGVVVLTQAQRKELKLQVAPVSIHGGVESGYRVGKVEADPDRKVVISPQVSGTVRELPVIMGSRVSRGARIAVLDSPDIVMLKGDYHQAEVERDLAIKELANKKELLKLGDESRRDMEEARLEVAKAKASHDGVAARLESATLSYQRLAQLRQEGIASSQQVEEARATRKALEADLREAKSALAIAGQHLEREKSVSHSKLREKAETFPAEANLARAQESMTHIRERLIQLGADPSEESGASVLYSPIEGIIVERPVSRGQVVAVGTTVAVLVDPREVWVWIDLLRTDLEYVKVGDRVELHLVSAPNVSALGRVQNIDAQVDAQSQTVRARVQFEASSVRFKVGSFVNATLLGSQEAPTVPQSAIVDVEGGPVIYVVQGDQFRRTPVTILMSGQNKASVRGLPIGAKIVVQGASDLKAADLASEIGGHHH